MPIRKTTHAMPVELDETVHPSRDLGELIQLTQKRAIAQRLDAAHSLVAFGEIAAEALCAALLNEADDALRDAIAVSLARVGGRNHRERGGADANAQFLVHRRMIDALTQEFGERRIVGLIRSDIRLAEAFEIGRPIFDHAPSSRGAQDYEALIERLSSLWRPNGAAASAMAEAVEGLRVRRAD